MLPELKKYFAEITAFEKGAPATKLLVVVGEASQTAQADNVTGIRALARCLPSSKEDEGRRRQSFGLERLHQMKKRMNL